MQVKENSSRKGGGESVGNIESEHRLISAIKTNTEITDSECYVNLQLQGTPVKLKIDTGSQANILPQEVFQNLKRKPKLTQTPTKLTSYTGDVLPIIGQCTLTCEGKDLEFFVVRTSQCPILCFKASQELGLIKVVLNINKADSLVKQFKDVFEGLGCLKTPYCIRIDLAVRPTICPPRNQPVALKSQIKEELDRMEQMKVIKKVEEPTDWVNAMVVVEKPHTKKLRICLDPRPLNKAILREHYQLPTLEDISTRLTGAKVFSKLDASHGYWQVPLDEESQLLTTFNSPFGRYCYTRMPFGIKSAQEIFQKRMHQNFGDLAGVETDIDDILVWGKNEEEHLQRLKEVLQRCREINLKLNMEKCQFAMPQVTYLGHIINAQGIAPDKERVRAICEMPPPQDKKGVERLLGTLNYVAKFIPDLSTLTHPIRELLKKDMQFIWEWEQKEAFRKVTEGLSAAPVLAFFDVHKPSVISCDASQTGLGAVLLQDHKPAAYVSCSMTSAETRYAQIEKELYSPMHIWHVCR